MLHLKFALNLENLADEMIEAVSASWTSPFESPIVIFPDPKLEQWFRLYWIQKKGVLANLNKKTIDSFLFDILVGDAKNKKKLGVDMLRNVIISYLNQKTGEKFNYEILDASVKTYLETDGNLDEAKLFDFANMMAGLFLEYETSRPSQFISEAKTGEPALGILDCWSQAKLQDFFIDKDGKSTPNERWQQKLYSALFHNKNGDSLLTKVFKKSSEVSQEQINYLTLPFLYKDCIDEKTGNIKFHYEKNLPVFILGLGGMGQFYRVILHEFSKQHEVYAYIQNPCMEFWEDCTHAPKSSSQMRPVLPDIKTDADDESENIDDNENDLLRFWGKAGRDNIKLWSMASDYDFNFNDAQRQDEKELIPTDTLFHTLQWMIAHRKNSFPESVDEASLNRFKTDNTFTVTSAPTKIREIELLHTNVCKLLSGETASDKKPAKINDILVVSPNIDAYRTAIYQVFDQTQEGFRVPFCILDSAAKDSLVTDALTVLFSIREKGTLSRPEFFALVRNPVVQRVRKIKPEEIANWESWTTNTNTYRDRFIETPDGILSEKPWSGTVKRLLLAKLSYTPITCGDETFAPYSDISSSDNNSLYRFIDCIESLENWIDTDRWETEFNNPDIPPEGLTPIYHFLDSWLLMSGTAKGLEGEAVIYQTVVQAQENLKQQFYAGSTHITWKCFSQTLLFAAKSSDYSCGNIFINGITFMKFAPNRIIPAKYVFFLGADANNFPGTRNNNTLDLRKCVRPWPGDDSIVAKNRYAFLCQLMSTSEGFFISYVNKDLQKDEDFYPSSIVNDIRSFLRNSNFEWQESSIPLDETRPWSELYTQREIRNKNSHLRFGNDSNVCAFSITQNAENDKLASTVSVYQLKEFLKDPFIFRVNQIMHIEEADMDPEKTEFEPIDTDTLQRTILCRQLISQGLGIIEDPHLPDIESVKNDAISKGLIPKGFFGKKVWDKIESDAYSLQNHIENGFPSTQFEFVNQSIEIQLDGWTLVGQIRLMAKSKSDIFIIDTAGAMPRNYHFLSGYIQALALLCEFERQNDYIPNISVTIFSQSFNATVKISETPQRARKLLNAIYQKAFVQKYNKLVPFDLLSNPSIKNFSEYVKLFYGENSESNPWRFFAGRKLFDIENVCGFSQENFMEEWNVAVEEQKALTPDIWKNLEKEARK